MASVCRQPPCSLNDVFGLWEDKVLQSRCIGQRHVVRGHPHDRAIEPLERLLVDAGRDLAGETARAGILVDDEHFVGVFHGPHDRRVVAGYTIFRPGVWKKAASTFWEWNGPPRT